MTDHGFAGPAVPDAGSGPFGIPCPSTHPLVSSVHGPTASAHLDLGSALNGECLGSLNLGAGLGKGVWIAYPLQADVIYE